VCSAAFARLAAVPCNNLEPDLSKPLLVAVGFSVGLGLGLDELSLDRIVDPVARPSDVLFLFSAGVVFSAGVTVVEERALARLEAVGLLGVPVSCGLRGEALGVPLESDGVLRAGPVWEGTSLQEDVDGVRDVLMLDLEMELADLVEGVCAESSCLVAALDSGVTACALVAVLGA